MPPACAAPNHEDLAVVDNALRLHDVLTHVLHLADRIYDGQAPALRLLPANHNRSARAELLPAHPRSRRPGYMGRGPDLLTALHVLARTLEDSLSLRPRRRR